MINGTSTSLPLLTELLARQSPRGTEAHISTNHEIERDPNVLREKLVAQDKLDYLSNKLFWERTHPTSMRDELENPNYHTPEYQEIVQERQRDLLRARIAEMLTALNRLTGGENGAPQHFTSSFGTDGDDLIIVQTTGTVDHIHTFDGDDIITVSAERVGRISAGKGSETVVVEATTVGSVFTGSSIFYDRDYGSDAVAIKARQLGSVITGAGNDAVAVHADIVEGVSTGMGDDKIAISAGALKSVYAGEGNDTVEIDAVMGSSFGYGWRTGKWASKWDHIDTRAEIHNPNPKTVEEKFEASRTSYQDVHLGHGDDNLTIKTDTAISVRGGLGNDLIHVQGGSVALKFHSGDGHDTIRLEQGVTFAIELKGLHQFTETWEGDTLTLDFGSHDKLRIEGARQSAGIGIRNSWAAPIEILHVAPPVDLVV